MIGSAGNQPAACIAASTSSLLPIKPDVKWIAWDITACSGHHRERRQAGLMLVMAPERRQRKIREREIGDEHAASNHQPSQVASHPNHPFLRRA